MIRCRSLAICLVAASAALGQETTIETTTDLVGRWRDDVIVTLVNQVLPPYGRQGELPGLSPQALTLSPDGKLPLVTGKTSELLVIDIEMGEVAQRVEHVAKEEIVETVWTKQKPSDLFGALSNALVFDPSGRTLHVANGTQTAAAVVHFDPDDKVDAVLDGLVRAGWFPGALAFDADRKALYVANIKGIASKPLKRGDGAEGFNSRPYPGSVSLMRIGEPIRPEGHSQPI